MSRLKKLVEETYKKRLIEAEEEAPAEDAELSMDDAGAPPAEAAEPVEGTEEEAPAEEEEEDPAEELEVPEEIEEPAPEENFEDLDKTIEGMVGITEIQHTTSSSIIDFEDGGQIMYIQPMVSIKSETLNKIIELIISDVKTVYSTQKDEITGKNLNKTKYWKSVETLISTMVKSQLTKSDNIDGLIDEIKQIFKVLEVK
jgi:hypothetical protein